MQHGMGWATSSRDIIGQVQTGLGRAAAFTSLPWARQQFVQVLGIDPYPGTLNLLVDSPSVADWQALTVQPGLRIEPERAGDCGARCYPVLASAAGRGPITAGVLVPEVPGYAAQQVEVLAAVSLREALALSDGATVTLRTVPDRNRRAVLFDVDGTLVNSLDGYRLAAEKAVQPYGWPVSREAVRRSLNTGEQFWDLVIPPELRGDVDLVARLRRDTMAHWPAVLDESVLLYPGIAPMLSRLRSAGVRLGICTASRGESFRPLEQAGLMDCFEQIITARDITRRKPDPEGLLLCMERMGVAPEDTAYIGDTVTDMQASHAAGLYTIGVLTGAADSSQLSGAGAHRILADLSGLPEILLV
jgi:HAD superfamily hydrolase (TIGR01509 family)